MGRPHSRHGLPDTPRLQRQNTARAALIVVLAVLAGLGAAEGGIRVPVNLPGLIVGGR
jgi:hypothetical protein